MDFEVFDGGRPIVDDPRVTILKQGNFNLNAAAMKFLKEANATHVQLLYAKKEKCIAFRPCPPKTVGAYRLRKAKGMGQISGTAFLKTYKIPFDDRTRLYPAKWDTKQSLLLIHLKD